MTSLSPAAQDFIAGGLSGAAAILAGAPLDSVRVRQQAAGGGGGSGSYGGGRGVSQPPSRLSALATARALVAQGGIGALWKGVGYPAAMIAVQVRERESEPNPPARAQVGGRP